MPELTIAPVSRQLLDQQYCRLVTRVLRDQLAPHSQVQDRLPELLDLIRAFREFLKMFERKSGIVGEGLGIGLVQLGHGGQRELVTPHFALCMRSFKLIAQRHQLIDLDRKSTRLKSSH